MIYAFIAFWVVLGLAVFLVAMRGAGRRAEGDRDESTATRLLTVGGVLIAFLFGLIVPTLILVDNADHKASAAVGGVKLTAAQVEGRELFERSCSYCHTLAATKSVGHVGPNLDVRVGDEISAEAGRKALVLSAILEGRARGLGQMPAGLYQGREAEDIASFVAAVAGH